MEGKAAYPELVTTRIARPSDAPLISEVLAEAFDDYRAWAPSEWSPPPQDDKSVAQLADALARPDVWCLLAFASGEVLGHVALALATIVDPGPPPAGTINLWQLFVRPPWQGRGVATQLMSAALEEGQRRAFTHIRLWTADGAARARSFYEREGWTATGDVRDDSPLGLPVLKYARRLDAS